MAWQPNCCRECSSCISERTWRRSDVTSYYVCVCVRARVKFMKWRQNVWNRSLALTAYLIRTWKIFKKTGSFVILFRREIILRFTTIKKNLCNYLVFVHWSCHSKQQSKIKEKHEYIFDVVLSSAATFAMKKVIKSY